jgi:glycosyltransferase involved in cell wall biosynthesis
LSYPFGFGEQWKKNELDVFSNYFQEIIIVPLTYAGNTTPKSLPPNTKLVNPLLDKGFTKTDLFIFLITLPFNGLCLKFLKEFVASGCWASWLKFKDWVSASILICRLYRHAFFTSLSLKDCRSSILYFFWGTGLSQSLTFLSKTKFAKIVVRFHGIDLYENRHPSGYIPYRAEQLRKIDLAALISNQGKDYITRRYSDIQFNSDIFRLGCISKGLSFPSEDGTFRIVSCSAIIPVKRINLISEALRYIKDVVIEWRHIGDGPLKFEIEDLNKKFPHNISFIFVGKVDSEKVLDEYAYRPIDLFLNVSESEGVPVSIMEAFSAGIPVLATDVGGTSEIVNGRVGKLLKSDITAKELAMEISNFVQKNPVDINKIRENCFRQYMENCNASIWATQMAEFLIKDR